MLREKNKLIIIAEAGVNHNGKLSDAFKLVDVAKKAGADFVKFQFFVPEYLATAKSPQAEYQKKKFKQKYNSQIKMLEKLCLTFNQLIKVKNYCKKKKINFLLSVFDHISVKKLNKFKLKFIKIPSGEINNYPLLKAIAKLKKKIILSTGMSNLNEIKNTLNILKKYKVKKNMIYLLHCTTDYPTKLKDVNLKSMNELQKKLKYKIGYSDHTKGNEASIAAVARGAKIIEKHFTLNKKMKGPDHSSSLEPKELIDFITSLRNTCILLGKAEKKITSSEKKNLNIVRKSIYALKSIKKGEKFTNSNIIPKRPMNGISPIYWDKVVGKKAKRNFIKDDKIKI